MSVGQKYVAGLGNHAEGSDQAKKTSDSQQISLFGMAQRSDFFGVVEQTDSAFHAYSKNSERFNHALHKRKAMRVTNITHIIYMRLPTKMLY
jgi:hypothetical protein